MAMFEVIAFVEDTYGVLVDDDDLVSRELRDHDGDRRTGGGEVG